MQNTVSVDREKYIGGSDIPSIMGISPFKSRFELLQEKAEIVKDSFEGNVYTEYGQNMESSIRAYVNSKMSRSFVEGKHVKELYINGELVQDIGIRCHTDGEDDRAVLEVKTTSQIYDDVDDYRIYLVQLLFYMVQTDKTEGVLAVYKRPDNMSLDFDPQRLQIFNIKVDDYADLLADMSLAVNKFVEDLHKLKENPFLTEAELMPVNITAIADGMVILEQKLANYKEIEAEYKRQKDRLYEAMTEAGVKSWRTEGGYIITAVAPKEDEVVTEEVVDMEKLKSHVRIYNEVVSTVEKVKAGRKGYVKVTAPRRDS